ncbi:MAG: beta-ketoacyl synthase N-terminal-like domain-containing protein, partial [Arenimonas sp.]
MSKRRVVITGMGIASPIGNTLETAWDSIKNGRSGIGQITHFDATPLATRIAGEVQNFDPKSFLPPKDAKKMDTFIHYGLHAAFDALNDSGLEITEANAERVG